MKHSNQLAIASKIIGCALFTFMILVWGCDAFAGGLPLAIVHTDTSSTLRLSLTWLPPGEGGPVEGYWLERDHMGAVAVIDTTAMTAAEIEPPFGASRYRVIAFNHLLFDGLPVGDPQPSVPSEWSGTVTRPGRPGQTSRPIFVITIE